MEDILRPTALVLPNIADGTSADFYNGEEGSFCFDVNATKLGFVTVAGTSEETVTSS